MFFCVLFSLVAVTKKARKNLSEIRNHLAQMIKEGRATDAIDMVIGLLGELQQKNTELEVKVHKLLKTYYGRKGEKISSDQLNLFVDLLAQNDSNEDEDAGEKKDEDGEKNQGEGEEPKPDTPSGGGGKKPRGRKKLPDNLRREEQIIKVPEDDRPCPNCNGERNCIGYEQSETLEFKPAEFYIKVHSREKLACDRCDGQIKTAPVGDKVIEKGLPGPGLLAEILVNKYRNHLPLFRQIQIFRRNGIEIPSSTMNDWIDVVVDMLSPVVNAEAKAVLASFLLQTDDTALKMLNHDHPANIVQGALWGHIGDHKHCYFFFSPDHKYHWPQDFLEEREGYIQCDAAPCYDALFANPNSKAIEVGCMMHCRRYFVAALDSGDLRAAIALQLIKKLYKIERKAKQARAGPLEISKIRLEKSKPLYDELGQWIDKHFALEPPKSLLGKALGYAKRQWIALGRFLEDGRLPIDNGAPERLNKIIAVGRRNYLFTGSEQGGYRTAMMYSLICGCELNNLNPWVYLNDVIWKISQGWPQSRLLELVPAYWSEIPSL